MATLTIRNVPDDLAARIKETAKRHENSVEQELRSLLQRSFPTREELWDAIADSNRRQSRPTTPEEIDAWRHGGRP